jgi:putative FmdB family regulatory protein
MPIYEYRCSACGHQDEFLRKLSEPALTECPACGKASFRKMLSAAGFQLKGSGWYATDFKNKGSKPAAEKKPEAEKKPDAKTETKTETKTTPATTD